MVQQAHHEGAPSVCQQPGLCYQFAMSNRSAKQLMPARQPNLFGDEQPDLFAGDALTPKAYQPKAEHVRNSLKKLVAEMQSADTWPWDPATTRLYCESGFEYLCSLLSDEQEAKDWRARTSNQTKRLKKSEAA